MSPPKVLLTGATGYIGVTILNQLVTSEAESLRDLTISLPVRGEDRAAKLKNKYGGRIVRQCGVWLPPSKRRGNGAWSGPAQGHDRPAHWMIHTSGCSNISDRPLMGTAHPDREWDDAEAEAVYEFEKVDNARVVPAAGIGAARPRHEPQGRRRGAQHPGLQRLWRGGGPVPGRRRHDPHHDRLRPGAGHGFALGDGAGAIIYVHVSGLAALYVRCVRRIVEDGGRDLPRRRAGILFPANGRTTMQDIARRCVGAAFDYGVLPRNDEGPRDREVRTVDLDEAATTTVGNRVVAEVGCARHRLTKGTAARKLGWESTRGQEAWAQNFRDELRAALAEKSGVAMGNCINEAAGDP
ncbi:hypothetical protein DL764_009109 [Monosporascus ibericus]|uniref:NAD-dependent epimerase/dehydratase domain-containing protein n=1 Tax=Monosporascus ibericus TaxID=155417 RepID=A0A4Q4SYR8_9PEZI|nr:hypothetical protein DL764_009109 [Monosporascus ibericus]